MNLKAFGDWVMVSIEEEQKRASGLIQLDDKGDPVAKGKLLSAGDKLPEHVKQSEYVYWLRRRDKEYTTVKGTLYFVHKDDILLVE